MVSAVQNLAKDNSCRRLVAILKETGLPGEASDHEWIAIRLQHHAENVSHTHNSEYLADLFVSGMLLERGLDPSKSKHLEGRGFPEAYLSSAPKLLQIGCPQATWQLVESGLLSYEGSDSEKSGRWVLKGHLLKSVSDHWHELGESLMIQRVAKGLIPLICDSSSSVTIHLRGVDRFVGRKWLHELHQHLPASEEGKAPCFQVLESCGLPSC